TGTLTTDAAAAIVVGDAYPPARQPGSPDDGFDTAGFIGPIATVTIPPATGPNVRVAGIQTPRDVPAATALRVGVDVECIDVTAQTSTVMVRIGGLKAGRASHTWTNDRA